MANKFDDLKEELDNSLLIHELKEKHGWTVDTFAGGNCVSVNMAKPGPLNSVMTVSFSITDMNDDEFYNLYNGLKNICFYPGDKDEQDKCVITAIRGNVYKAIAKADDVHTVSFALNFANSMEKVNEMSVSEIVSEVSDAGAEVSTVDDCLFGEQYDRPEMKQIEDFLNENGIPFTRDIELQYSINELTVDDDELGLHFTVSAGMEGEEFTLKGGLQFNEREFDRYHNNSVSVEDFIDRLKAVENQTGEYKASEDLSLNIYALISDGEDDFAVIGPNRNDAVPCLLGQDGRDNPGYLYGNIFIPVNEIRHIASYEHGDVQHEQTDVLKDAEPGRKMNARSGVVSSRLADMDEQRSNVNKNHNTRSTKNYDDPGGRG